MKTLNIKISPCVSDFFDEVLQPNAFGGGESYVKRRLVCGALVFWVLQMVKGKINEKQRQAYIREATKVEHSNERIFDLAVAYLRAKRGVEGYRIDGKKIVWGPNLNQEL